MKKAGIVIGLFISTLAYGQHAEGIASSRGMYKTVPGITIIDSISSHDVLGGFAISSGFGGFHFRLEANSTFKKVDFSCMMRFIADSGSWSIKDQNTVILRSKSEALYFDMVRFDNFYFFIQPAQRCEFIADLQAATKEYHDFKPVILDEKILSAKTMIAMRLGMKYYTKEIVTGT